jgi:hypothetical protein
MSGFIRNHAARRHEAVLDARRDARGAGGRPRAGPLLIRQYHDHGEVTLPVINGEISEVVVGHVAEGGLRVPLRVHVCSGHLPGVQDLADRAGRVGRGFELDFLRSSHAIEVREE